MYPTCNGEGIDQLFYGKITVPCVQSRVDPNWGIATVAAVPTACVGGEGSYVLMGAEQIPCTQSLLGMPEVPSVWNETNTLGNLGDEGSLKQTIAGYSYENFAEDFYSWFAMQDMSKLKGLSKERI